MGLSSLINISWEEVEVEMEVVDGRGLLFLDLNRCGQDSKTWIV